MNQVSDILPIIIVVKLSWFLPSCKTNSSPGYCKQYKKKEKETKDNDERKKKKKLAGYGQIDYRNTV